MQGISDLSEYLAERGLRVVTAESCTAGLVAAKLGAIPGCGRWLECSYVTYSPEAKHRILGVRFETIERFNLTSEAVAREMVEGALAITPVNVALANTGVAGPAPGDGGIAPGTVCFAWGFRLKEGIRTITETRHFSGDRNAVREAAAGHAILQIPVLYAALSSTGGSQAVS